MTYDINIDTVALWLRIEDILYEMRNNPAAVRYKDLCAVCSHYFGQPRQTGGSHRVYKTPWIGDPRVNIQNDKGRAKIYQVRQALKAVERLEMDNEAE